MTMIDVFNLGCGVFSTLEAWGAFQGIVSLISWHSALDPVRYQMAHENHHYGQPCVWNSTSEPWLSRVLKEWDISLDFREWLNRTMGSLGFVQGDPKIVLVFNKSVATLLG